MPSMTAVCSFRASTPCVGKFTLAKIFVSGYAVRTAMNAVADIRRCTAPETVIGDSPSYVWQRSAIKLRRIFLSRTSSSEGAARRSVSTNCGAGPRLMYSVSAKPEAARANEGGRIRAGGSVMTDRRVSLNSEAL
jgi:hypothetical protein